MGEGRNPSAGVFKSDEMPGEFNRWAQHLGIASLS
jgi:hypothetical protein